MENSKILAKITRKRGRPKGFKNSLSGIKKREKLTSDAFQMAKFQKGKAAGPGRPFGSRNKLTVALEQIGADSAENVFSKLVDLALGRTKEGDAKACKAVIDIVLSLGRNSTINLGFESSIETPKDVSNLSKKVVNMMVTGELSAEESIEIGNKLEQHLRIITDIDVMDKIDATCQKVDMITKKRGI